MLPPLGVKLIEVNPAIINASQTSANLYFYLFLCELSLMLNTFNTIV